MPINFAGVDLLLEDPEGAVRAWLDQHLSELYASIFCLDNTAIREARFASIANTGSPVTGTGSSGFPASDTATVRRVGLPVGNYPRPPKPRINSLYWPTGAMRWAHGLFLISKGNLDAVLAACAGEQPEVFTLTSGLSGIEASLFALAPRPVSAPGVAPNNRLWLLPLVDVRYFWQFYHVRQYAPTTWASALSSIAGYTTNDNPDLGEAVPSAYGRPSAMEFVRDFENAALLVDAVALSVGRRLVGGPIVEEFYKFKKYKTQSASAAKTVAAANLSTGWDVVAGGDFSNEAATLGNAPGDVVVTYGNAAGDRVGGYAEYDKPSGANNGGSKVFHCSAAGNPSVPENGKYTTGFEQALTNQIGTDYYQWLELQYDITYAGIVPWQVSGFDDYVRWDVSVHGKGRRRRFQCQTRAVSMPPNFGFESLPIDPLSPSSSSSSSPSSSSSVSSSPSSSSTSSNSSSPSSASSSPSSTSSGSSESSGSSSHSSESSHSQSSASSGSSPSSPSSGSSGSSGSSASSAPSGSSGSGGSSTQSSQTSSHTSSSQSSASSGSSASSAPSGSSGSGGSSNQSGQSSTLSSSGQSSASSASSGSSGSSGSAGSSGQSSGNSGTSSGGSNNGSGGGSGSQDSSNGSQTSSGGSSGSSGSGTSGGSGTSSGTSGSRGSSGSSGIPDGCTLVVTDVTCGTDGLSVTRRPARVTFCD